MPLTGPPRRGDVLLRGSFETGFQLLDPLTHRPIAANLVTLADVVATARRLGATGIWQEARPAGRAEVRHRTTRIPMDD